VVNVNTAAIPLRRLACRMLDHRPLTAGADPTFPGGRHEQWVECARCAGRPEPRGTLDPDHWPIGHPYAGRFDRARECGGLGWQATAEDGRYRLDHPRNPGRWPGGPNRSGRRRLALAALLDRMGARTVAITLRAGGMRARWAHGAGDTPLLLDEVDAYLESLRQAASSRRRRVRAKARATLATHATIDTDWW